MSSAEAERCRWAIHTAIVAALATRHPRAPDVARALEQLLTPGGGYAIPDAGHPPASPGAV